MSKRPSPWGSVSTARASFSATDSVELKATESERAPDARRPRRIGDSAAWSRRVRYARLWNDPSLGEPLALATVVFLAISLLSAVLVLLALMLGYPASPLVGVWPTHGWYMQLPSCFLVLLGPLGLQTQSATLLKIVFALAALIFVLDAYAFVTNVVWIGLFYTGLLSAAARSHHSVLQVAPYVLVLLCVFALHLAALVNVVQAMRILPDLKRLYHVQTQNDDGTWVDHDDDDGETAQNMDS